MTVLHCEKEIDVSADFRERVLEKLLRNQAKPASALAKHLAALRARYLERSRPENETTTFLSDEDQVVRE